MNLDELIQALQDLKESGKAIDKLPVKFSGRKKNKEIDGIKIHSTNQNSHYNYIELFSLD